MLGVRGWAGVVLVLAGGLSCPPASAGGGVALQGGISNGGPVDARRLDVSGRWAVDRWAAGNWALIPLAELTVGRLWAQDAGRGEEDALTEGGVRAVLRLRRRSWDRLFLEAGCGPVLRSGDRLGSLDLGGRLHFRTDVGIGARLGAARRWALSYGYSHTSNAHLATPNPGINFHILRMRYSY
ncbi:hypothetical protein AN478_09710 [Thiohalorhabdus denitrificans]|nr:hypothetical protein AN478_09710 [Thiohalorhabdus denitrificans]